MWLWDCARLFLNLWDFECLFFLCPHFLVFSLSLLSSLSILNPIEVKTGFHIIERRAGRGLTASLQDKPDSSLLATP